MSTQHKFPYEWTLADARFTKDKGKVFSCFACGGGSTMGYKLAGFDVIGDCEIDPRMNKCYVENHHPKYNFLQDIRDFKKREDLPKELYNLDILDGSPPCSTFSMAGMREDAWGKEKKFKEGQVAQTLDTLFFDWIDLVKKLKPKVAIAENVRGIVQGDAKKYVRAIYFQLERAGYYVQHFLLNGKDMGLPQYRQRVFFIALRQDLAKPFLKQTSMFEQSPYINMTFFEPEILTKEICDYNGRPIPPGMRCYHDVKREDDRSIGDIAMREKGKLTMFNNLLVQENMVCPTLAAREGCLIHYEKPLYFSVAEACKISSFPLDYKFLDQNPHYIMGMSVPPVMTAHVASRVWEQWLSKM